MKTAFISDIHSNLPALQSVLEEIQHHGVDNIYCLGDLVGYHSQPNEVIELIRQNGIICIKGNHDLDISERGMEFPEENIKGWTYRRLKSENLNFLKALPSCMIIDLDGISIQMVHGSPASITEYMFENEDVAERYMDEFSGDILMAGHTHYPFIKGYDTRYLVNTGSVGRPKIGKPEASYILLEVSDRKIDSLTINFTPYDFRKAMEDMERNGLSEKVTRELALGRVL